MLLTNPFRPDPRVHEEAKSLVKNGYDVTILCWDRGEGLKRIEKADGIEVRRILVRCSYGVPGRFILGLARFYIRALKEAKKFSFSYVHANDFDTLPLGLMLKKLRGAKLIYDAHDHYSSMIADVLPNPVAKFVGALERRMVRFTDGRIAASEPMGKEIFSPLDFTPVLNAKRLDDYKLPEERVREFRREINPEGKFLIVYIGILKLWSPLPHIIKAVKNMEGVKLIVGGKGPHEEEILKMIEGASNIEYRGWINKNDIPLYTLASDVIILPSNPRKTYTRLSVPNKLMEALAAGKPMIAGLNTAGGKIVEECNSGFLCLFGDVECIREKIHILMKNEELRKELGNNARKCAESKYNWDAMERRLIEVYKRA
ncbi:MAG: glycosyltransferase family 4 protein [Thermoplasmata archaeon]|nr:glycosyltransferase family 4 protein [Thermoplasmata archaeon]